MAHNTKGFKLRLDWKPVAFTCLFGQVMIPVQVAEGTVWSVLATEMAILCLGISVGFVDRWVKKLKGNV